MNFFIVTGKSWAVRVSAVLAAAVATALLLGTSVGPQVSGAVRSSPQSPVATQASDPPPDGCCGRGETVCPPEDQFCTPRIV
jgi:hypothetical protein